MHKQADEHQLLILCLFSCNEDKYNNGLMFTSSNNWIVEKLYMIFKPVKFSRLVLMKIENGKNAALTSPESAI